MKITILKREPAYAFDGKSYSLHVGDIECEDGLAAALIEDGLAEPLSTGEPQGGAPHTDDNT